MPDWRNWGRPLPEGGSLLRPSKTHHAPGAKFKKNLEMSTGIKINELDRSPLETKTRPLRKNLVRKLNRQTKGTSRPKETTLIPKKAEVRLQEESQIIQTWSQSTPRFGRLSHNSFFSRHKPHPRQVSHIPDHSGNPICTVRDNKTYPLQPLPGPGSNYPFNIVGMPQVLMPIGDPRSLLEPRLTLNSLSNVWREELKELTSKGAAFSKEAKVKKKKKEETERLAQYSRETGRLIPDYIPAMTSRGSRSSPRHNLCNKSLTPIAEDQELMILELLYQILQTDSLIAIQHWLVTANPREKDLVLGLLKKAMAEMIPHSLISSTEERILTSPSRISPVSAKSLMFQKSLKLRQNGPKAGSALAREKPDNTADPRSLCQTRLGGFSQEQEKR